MRFTKWSHPSRNLQVGDLVCVREDTLVPPTKWPLARVVSVHPGEDGFVRVATLRTAKGVYKHPVTKIALLLPNDSSLFSCFILADSVVGCCIILIHFTNLWLLIDSLKSVQPWPAGCRVLIYVVDHCVACFLFWLFI